jgi:3-hydroxybutyryl-CoA dehydratase
MFVKVDVGDQAITKKIFTDSDLQEYACLLGKKTFSSLSKINTVPDALIAGLFSMILGTTLPGEGTIYLKQKLSAKVEIVNIRQDKGLITCKTTCLDSKNKIICEGEALVMNKAKVS